MGLCRSPCAIMEPPVMLWVMSLSPGFMLSIFAGVVCIPIISPGGRHHCRRERNWRIPWNTCSI